ALYLLLPDQMAIAKLMPEIAMLDRLRVGLPHVVNAHESAKHRKMAGNRIMQPCKKPVYNMHTSTWMNVEARASGTRPDHASVPGRFEGSHDRCSDRDDSASPSTGSINGICGRGWDMECSGIGFQEFRGRITNLQCLSLF